MPLGSGHGRARRGALRDRLDGPSGLGDAPGASGEGDRLVRDPPRPRLPRLHAGSAPVHAPGAARRHRVSGEPLQLGVRVAHDRRRLPAGAPLRRRPLGQFPGRALPGRRRRFLVRRQIRQAQRVLRPRSADHDSSHLGVARTPLRAAPGRSGRRLRREAGWILAPDTAVASDPSRWSWSRSAERSRFARSRPQRRWPSRHGGALRVR